MRKVAYLGLDAHAGSCTLGEMDSQGNYRGDRCFPTSERNITDALKAAALHYIDLRNQQTALKQKIKAMYQHWGFWEEFGGRWPHILRLVL